MISLESLITVTLILFAIIDIVGALPILIDLEQRVGKIDPLKTAVLSTTIMIAFLFIGEPLLKIIGIDLPSFAAAGSVVLFIVAMEMILGIRIFKEESSEKVSQLSALVVPVTFPIIAGAGTLTTILTIRADYPLLTILLAILINGVIIFIVLWLKNWIANRLSPAGLIIIRRVFGIILLASAIKIFKNYAL